MLLAFLIPENHAILFDVEIKDAINKAKVISGRPQEEHIGRSVSQKATIRAGAPLPLSIGITITKMVAPIGGSLSMLLAFSIPKRPEPSIVVWADR